MGHVAKCPLSDMAPKLSGIHKYIYLTYYYFVCGLSAHNIMFARVICLGELCIILKGSKLSAFIILLS